MSLHTLTNALEKLIEDEIAGKAQLERALESQENAIVAAQRDELDLATRTVELAAELELDRARGEVELVEIGRAHV